jgi:REP element-mobilizing transposase RayT
MPQSFANDFVHIVFSTKHRHPFLHDGIRDRMFAYMGGICNNFESTTIIIGGYYDHVHILCDLSRKYPMMKLVEEVKSRSSRWIKHEDDRCTDFYWQHGYAGFSVDRITLKSKINYIERQIQHHQKIEFKPEYRLFLDEHEQQYDERYMWD